MLGETLWRVAERYRLVFLTVFIIRVQAKGLAISTRVLLPWSGKTRLVTLLLRWKEAAVIFLLLGVTGTAFHYWNELCSSWLFSQWAPQNAQTAASCVALLVFLIGLLLASWKRNQQFVYGMTEVLFGVLSAFQIGLLLWPKPDSSKVLGIASALYVISRGSGNVAEAFAKEAAVIERVKVEDITGGPLSFGDLFLLNALRSRPEQWPPSIIDKSDSERTPADPIE